MAQLNIKLPPERLEALRRYAARRRTPVAWLIKDYVEYLLAGGDPMAAAPQDELSSEDLSAAAREGGSFDWLAEEPDLYTLADGESI